MSVILQEGDCILIEHERQTIKCLENEIEVNLKLSEKLFMNFKRKQKLKKQITSEESELEHKIKEFLTLCSSKNIFKQFTEDDIDRYKNENIELMNKFYNLNNSEFNEFHGENNLNTGVITTLNNSKYIIPPKCKFFNKNVKEISNFLPTSEKFDFIVIDSPWTNRYIKRLKKTNKSHSYQMMSDEDIMSIEIENYTHKSSIVVIWCTNSLIHQTAVEQKFLPKWNLKIEAKWKWVKIDKCGQLFCSFEGSKKPFETIYVCTHVENNDPRDAIQRNALIFSQPSSIHSHKPPLQDLFNHVLPSESKCLEIFARSLYTNFTSIGMEVLKLQNVLLFENDQ